MLRRIEVTSPGMHKLNTGPLESPGKSRSARNNFRHSKKSGPRGARGGEGGGGGGCRCGGGGGVGGAALLDRRRGVLFVENEIEWKSAQSILSK